MACSFFPPYLLQSFTRLPHNSCSYARLEITSSSKVSQYNCALKGDVLNKLVFSSSLVRLSGYCLNFDSTQTESSTR